MVGKLPKSPLAPAAFPALAPIAGVRLAGCAVGLKASGAKDLMVAELAAGTTIAGTLTRSRCPSAPVEWCRSALPGGQARAIIVNSGNANAFTGLAGDTTVAETVRAASAAFGCAEQQVFVASTGVIGVPVPPDYIAGKLPLMVEALAGDTWHDAAQSIMTTDTFAKGATQTATIDGVPVTLSGFAKGSGMIAPDMATMLGFIFTDAAIAAPALQQLVAATVDRTFNCITVDSDTSTSDTVLVAATGQAQHDPITDPSDPRGSDFTAALDRIMTDLATQIVRDGEGATKFITIDVSGAASDRAARVIGLSIANSPLVKTAFAGGDANWGRIVMAVGKAGEAADRDRLSIAMGGIDITRNGQLVPNYDEAPVAAHLAGQQVTVAVDVGIASGRARVWTCDLTHGYITINGDYRS